MPHTECSPNHEHSSTKHQKCPAVRLANAALVKALTDHNGRFVASFSEIDFGVRDVSRIFEERQHRRDMQVSE